jgi:hypothetical protein
LEASAPGARCAPSPRCWARSRPYRLARVLMLAPPLFTPASPELFFACVSSPSFPPSSAFPSTALLLLESETAPRVAELVRELSRRRRSTSPPRAAAVNPPPTPPPPLLQMSPPRWRPLMLSCGCDVLFPPIGGTLSPAARTVTTFTRGALPLLEAPPGASADIDADTRHPEAAAAAVAAMFTGTR